MKYQVLMYLIPSRGQTNSHTVNKCPFNNLLNATFFAFLSFLLVISLTRRHSARVLSSDPKQRKAVRCLTEETHVLDKLSSGTS